MASYRFCRPDDLPLLVRAVNECYNIHFPDEAPMTVERFRREMKERDVWPSNSMVAMGGPGGKEPIAVSIGTKRVHEVSVDRVGIRTDFLRQGHGGHLVTSLSQKLAVLGPERLVAEVRQDDGVALSFFASQGYRPETTYTDYLLTAERAAELELVPEGWVVPISVDDLESAGTLARRTGSSGGFTSGSASTEDSADSADSENSKGPPIAWDRSPETLLGSRERLDGLAVVTPERIESHLLYRPTDEETGTCLQVVALSSVDAERHARFAEILLRAVATGGPDSEPIEIPRLAQDEIPAETLTALGFERQAQYARLTATAQPL